MAKTEKSVFTLGGFFTFIAKSVDKTSRSVFRAQNYLHKTYDGYRPAIERFWGLRPSYVKVTRQHTDNGGIVFNFEGVSIVDSKQQIKEPTSIEETGLKENVPAKEIEGGKPADTKTPIEYYDVKLAIDDPKVCLGEIDYCDWEKRKEFQVIVTRQGEAKSLDPNDPKYKQVLATLKMYTKVSINPSLTPNQIAADKIKEVADNLPGKAVDAVKSLFKPDNRVGEQSFDVLGGQNDHFTDTTYLKGLVEVAIDRAQKEDFSILENYHYSREQDINNELFPKTKERKELENTVRKEEHEAFNKKIADNSLMLSLSAGTVFGVSALPFVIIGLSALLTASMVIFPLPFSIPLHGLLAVGTGVATFYGLPKLISRYWPAATTKSLKISWSVIKEKVTDFFVEPYKDERLNNHKNELKDKKEEEKLLHNSLKKEEKVKNSGINTLKAINRQNKNQSLGLSGLEIGPIGTSIVCDYLHRSTNLPSCNKIILSNCGITEAGVKELAITLKEAQIDPKQLNMRIQEIDLRNNKIGPEGLNALKEISLTNFTLIALKMDQPQDEISRQVLTNRCLQGTLTEAPKPAPSKILPLRLLTSESYDEKLYKQFSTLFPDGFEQLKKGAIQKLKNNFSITAFPATQNKEISELATKVTKQNALLQQLLSTSNPKEIATKSLEAFNLDNGRFVSFMIDQKLTSKLEEASKEDIGPEQKEGLVSVMQAISSRQQKLNSKTLIEQFACLHTSSSIEQFPALQELLKSQYITLTQFTFPKDITPNEDVKKYMENVTRRNRIGELLESMSDPVSKGTFQKFWDIYKAMDPSHLITPAINIGKLQKLIKSSLLDLRDLTLDDRINLLQGIFAPGDDTKQNITLLATIIGKLPKEDSAISRTMNNVLQKAFEHLTDHDFIKGLEGKRQSIATNTPYSEQKVLLFILDSTLHPALKLGASDSLAYKKYLLQKLITADPTVNELDPEQTFANFIDIYKTIPEDQLPLSIDIPGNANLTKNVQLFITLLEKSIKGGAELSPTMQVLLQKSFTHRTQDHSEFVIKLEEKRLEIAMGASGNKEQKYILYTIDSVLHPDLKPDSLEYQKYDLQGLINNAETTFKDFIDTYKTIPKDKAALALAGSDYNKLITLVEKDVYDSEKKQTVFQQLRDPELSSKLKQALLEFCFGPDNKDKAMLLTNILSDKEISEQFLDKKDLASFRENFLLYAFTWPVAGGWVPIKHKTYTFDEIKAGLDQIRLSLLAQNNVTEAKILDRPLQQVLQTNLMEKFACLRSSTTDNFTALKEYLNTKDFDLREFEPPSNIDLNPDVKTYMQQILLRNQIRDIITTYPATIDTLKIFVDLYKKIDPQYLTEPPIDMQKLLNLVTLDLQRDKTNSSTMGVVLKSLDEKKRRTLFELCFKQDLVEQDHTEDTNYTKKAVLISTMLASAKSLDSRNNDDPKTLEYLLDHAFNNPKDVTEGEGSSGEEIPPYNYERLKKELTEQIKNKKTKDSDKFEILDAILLADLEEDLASLNKELNLDPLAYKKLQLQQLITKYPLDSERTFAKFVDIYKTIPNEKCQEMIATFDKLNVLKLIAQDLGTKEKVTCKKLRELNPEHRIPLLENCFLINDVPKDAHQKALITANLLESWLFKQTSKTSQDIKKQIYLGIKPYQGLLGLQQIHPHYPLEQLKSELETIAKTQGIDTDLKTNLERALAAPGEILDKKLEQKSIKKPENSAMLSEEEEPQLKNPALKAL